MLRPSLRPIALSLLLFSSIAAISQTVGFANIPYTATKKVTFIQKLADGTTITRVNTNTEARDSQGRTVQQTILTGTPGQDIIRTTVMDPVARTNTVWTSQVKQATAIHMPEPRRTAPPSGSLGSGSGSGVMGTIGSAGSAPEVAANFSVAGASTTDPNLHPARQTEKLGGKTIAGVYAEGTRITITYPVGFLGNDRPIVNVRETWMSPDLKIVVLATDDDPRNGSRTTELTNLVRGEPDPALFQVPEGYTIKDQYPGSN
jgi:hypothetical protein